MVTDCAFSFERSGFSEKCGQGLYIWLLTSEPPRVDWIA